MKKGEVKVGGLYLAKVSDRITTVRIDSIREALGINVRNVTLYDCTNLKTGRKLTFRSAAKFRGPAPEPRTANLTHEPPAGGEPNVGINDGGRMASDPPTDSEPAEDRRPTDAEAANHAREDREEAALAREDEQRPDPTPVAPTDATIRASSPATAAAPAAGRGLAARIAGARLGRQLGAPVAGMVPNEEQEAILAAASEPNLKVLVVGAGAGTGKTATLKMLEQVLSGCGQYTAFNTNLVAESKAKFVKAACNTTHSLAFRAVGKLYQHRLGGDRMRSGQVARILGIEDFWVALRGQGPPSVQPCQDCKGRDCPTCEGRGTISVPTDWIKVLSAEFLAGQVLTACRRFCQSADPDIGPQHIRYVDGIDISEQGLDFDGGIHARRGRENNDRLRDYLLPHARRAWDDLSRPDGQLPFSHDVYVKVWQLGQGDDRPIIAADYILLDEAQDTAPVFLDIIRRQEHALLVLVGDSNQAIYEWRGAVDAMKTFPDAPRRLLSQSYRFGQAVADVANTILATLEEPTDLRMRGHPDTPSRVASIAAPRCYLFRTNAGAIGQVMSSIGEGKRPHLIGGGADTVAWMQAAVDLQSKRGTRHPELCCFESWGEVQEYSKTDEGSDLRLMVKLVDEFTAEAIRDALKNMPKEEDADLVVSTAHKSKGREWDTVKLGPDFPTANKMSDPDRRLLYVAATRAKLTLDISECPPFCGGEDWGEDGGERRWIPGLKVAYTQAMPSAEDQARWIEANADKAPSPPKSQPTNGGASQPAQTSAEPRAADTANPTYTWTNVDMKWCVRGPGDAPLGAAVKVSRKNGTASMVTLRTIVRRYGDTWIYGV